MTKKLKFFVVGIIAMLILTSCGPEKKSETGNYEEVQETTAVQNEASTPIQSEPLDLAVETDVVITPPIQEPPIHEEKTVSVTLAAVGDLMVHKYQLTRGYKDNTFDFAPSFKYVEPILSSADFTLGNLETTLSGENGQRCLGEEGTFMGYSGFPCFNSPDVFAENIKGAGFDLVSTANNHSLDGGVQGLIRTIEVLDEIELNHIGTYTTEADSADVYIEDIQGIRFGFVNYTYGMNGFVLPKNDNYMVHHLNNYDPIAIEAMFDHVRDVRAMDVDFVVVMLHYGKEYVNLPDKQFQKPIIDGLIKAGADIIFGGHPHVLQPIEVKEVEDDKGNVKQGLVVYSLGNFLSSQRNIDGQGPDKDIGAIVEVTLEKVDDLKPEIVGVAFTPTYTYWTGDAITIIPTLSLPEGINFPKRDMARINYANTKIVEHLSSFMNSKGEFDGMFYRWSLR